MTNAVPGAVRRVQALVVNQVLAPGLDQDGPLLRVLHIDAERVVLIDTQALRALPYWRPLEEVRDDLARGVLSPAVLPATPVGRLTDSAIAVRDQRWEVIRQLVLPPVRRVLILDRTARGRLVLKAAALHKVSKVAVMKYLRRYWQRGQMQSALLPDFDRCAARGRIRAVGVVKRGYLPERTDREDPEKAGINVTPDVAELLRRGYAKYFAARRGNGRERLSLRQAYNETLRESFSIGQELKPQVAEVLKANGKKWEPVLPPARELPTLVQFTYWGRLGLDRATTVRNRVGQREFNLNHRTLTGSANHGVTGPGVLYQIDATVADVYLLSPGRNGRIIGRPVLYVVVDVYSRLVVGFYVCLEGPNWAGARFALEHAFCDKVDFCRRYGRVIEPADWPSGLSRDVLGDRGELLSHDADHAVKALTLTVSNAPPCRGDWKPVVERYFGLIRHESIRFVPGAVPTMPERGGPDYRLDARLTLATLNELLVELFFRFNHTHRLNPDVVDPGAARDNVPPFPIDLWRWGLANRVGALRVAPRETVRAALLPSVTAVPTPRGVRINTLRYVIPESVPNGRALRGDRWRPARMEFGTDDRDVSTVFLRTADGEVVPCALHPHHERFLGMTLEEMRDLRALEKEEELRDRDRQLAGAVAFADRADEIVASVTAQPNSTRAGASADREKQPTTPSIRADRKAARIEMHRESVAENQGQTRPALGIVRASGSYPTNTPLTSEPRRAGYVPPPDDLALLQLMDDSDSDMDPNDP